MSSHFHFSVLYQKWLIDQLVSHFCCKFGLSLLTLYSQFHHWFVSASWWLYFLSDQFCTPLVIPFPPRGRLICQFCLYFVLTAHANWSHNVLNGLSSVTSMVTTTNDIVELLNLTFFTFASCLAMVLCIRWLKLSLHLTGATIRNNLVQNNPTVHLSRKILFAPYTTSKGQHETEAVDKWWSQAGS